MDDHSRAEFAVSLEKGSARPQWRTAITVRIRSAASRSFVDHLSRDRRCDVIRPWVVGLVERVWFGPLRWPGRRRRPFGAWHKSPLLAQTVEVVVSKGLTSVPLATSVLSTGRWCSWSRGRRSGGTKRSSAGWRGSAFRMARGARWSRWKKPMPKRTSTNC
jgi:hypothetical protein